MPSITDRLNAQYQQQYGKPADPADAGYASWIQTALPQIVRSDHDAYERSKARWRTADKFAWAGVAAPFAIAAAPAIAGALGGGAAASGGGAAAAGSAAGSAGAGATGAGMSIPWWSVASKGADTLFGIYANRTQNKANERALAYQMTKDAEALRYDREAEAERKRQFDLQQAGLERQWAAAEDDRRYQRQLLEEREARLAPRRAAAAAALDRVNAMLSRGSLGSYRRG